MSAELIFPAGVKSGRPFTTPLDAVSWLATARAGEYGPIADVAPRVNSPWPWTLAPEYAIPPTTRVMLDGSKGDDWNMVYPSVVGHAPLEPPAPPPYCISAMIGNPALIVHEPGSPLTPIYGVAVAYDQIPPVYWAVTPLWLLLYRAQLGWQWAVRQVFDAATKPERRKLARVLQWHEDATTLTGEQFVTLTNRWITAAWTDAVNSDLSVSPHPTNPDPALFTHDQFVLVPIPS